MRYLALIFVLSFFLYSCETSEPEVDDTNVVTLDETATDEESEENEEETEEEESEEGETEDDTDEETEEQTDEETGEETEEDDRWASFVHSSITIEPYYYPNSEIEFSTNQLGYSDAKIIAGDKLVFYYLETAGDRIDTITGARLADSGYKKGLLFAIDADKTEFKLEIADFNTASTKLGLYSGANPFSGYHDVTDGTIEGVKISETEWKIDLDIIWTIITNPGYDDILRDFELSSNFIPEPQE